MFSKIVAKFLSSVIFPVFWLDDIVSEIYCTVIGPNLNLNYNPVITYSTDLWGLKASDVLGSIGAGIAESINSATISGAILRVLYELL